MESLSLQNKLSTGYGIYRFDLDQDCTLGSRLAENDVWITCQLDGKPMNYVVNTGVGVTVVGGKNLDQKGSSGKPLWNL